MWSKKIETNACCAGHQNKTAPYLDLTLDNQSVKPSSLYNIYLNLNKVFKKDVYFALKSTQSRLSFTIHFNGLFGDMDYKKYIQIKNKYFSTLLKIFEKEFLTQTESITEILDHDDYACQLTLTLLGSEHQIITLVKLDNNRVEIMKNDFHIITTHQQINKIFSKNTDEINKLLKTDTKLLKQDNEEFPTCSFEFDPILTNN